MTQKHLLAVAAAAALMGTGAAQASIDLVAIGSLDGHGSDLSTATAAPLENGVAGNLFGGIGSGMTYAGCNTFLAVPDRGPNAVAYNSAVDDTTSYINRFHTLTMTFSEAPAGSALPLVLTPTLSASTLLWANKALTYGTGASVGLGSGVPALNTASQFYFTGRSDNFDASKLSTNKKNGRFDPESIRVSAKGKQVYISDEYGPYIYKLDRATGKRVATIQLPDMFAVSTLSPVGNTEISSNTAGRVANKGMEGLAISPDGNTLYGMMQSPLIQDGGTAAPYTRIVKIDLTSKTVVAQYAYPLTNIGSTSSPKYPTVSEILALNGNELLVDERDGKGLGDNSTAAYKKVYRIDLSGATDVSNVVGSANLAPAAVTKTLVLDIVAKLSAAGISTKDIPAKIESLSFGPDVSIGGVTRHTLWTANDNDFIGTVTDSNHPSGKDNPNMFYVFAFDDADLSGYVPQTLTCR